MLLNIGRAIDDIGFIIPHETGPGSVADKANRIICVKAGECGLAPVQASCVTVAVESSHSHQR
jgi:hypothetical protein